MTKKPTIGFIGTGVMGKSMASHLLQAEFPLHIFTRTKKKAEELLQKGAKWEASVAQLAKKCDVIITMIGTPDDVREVYLSEEGLLNNARENTYLIDMTTSSPKLAEEIYQKAKNKKMFTLDAPVSGGDVGAKNGTLTIMIGGDREVYEEMVPILELLGTNIVLQGKAGAGQHTKMVNQITIAPMMIGLAEALLYAKKAHLNTYDVLKSIETGAAGSWSLSNYAPRILAGDFAPGFAIKHYIKDMKIALQSAEEMGLETPGLSLALQMYKRLAEMGEEEKGIHAIVKYFEV